MSFGKYLKKVRTQQKISQRDLAQNVGVDFTYISKIENDVEMAPSENTLIKMADAFGIDRYDFIMEAGKIPTDFVIAILSDEDVRNMLKEKVSMYPKDVT